MTIRRDAAQDGRSFGPQLFLLAVRDAAVPSALVLGADYAALAFVHARALEGDARVRVVALAAVTSALFFALAWRWRRHAPTPESFITWAAGLVTLNNVHAIWTIGTTHEAVGFYLAQAGLGFVGLAWRRYWTLTALIGAGFSIGPLRAGFAPPWPQATMILVAVFVLSFMMQAASARYRERVERATRESERQRLAAEAALARMREEVARREQLQERLARAERLEGLGLLAGGVAHDFNNLLAAVIGNATLALSRGASPALRADVEAILDAGERAALLAKELLAYAGRGTGELSPLDLAREVAGVARLAQSSLPSRVALRTLPSAGDAVVRGDRAQIQQVALNLILNAADATARSGSAITVETGRAALGAEEASALEPAQPRAGGAFAFLRVADDGVGMTDETRRHAFDPFYTTKESGRGLGLAAALGIARAHGGGFRVESALGRGTEFTLYLPLSDARVETSEPPDAVVRERSGAQILVVDDEPAVRRMLARALEFAGFRAIEAAGGREAEAELRHAPSIVAAVVDMSMPGVDGEGTLALLRALRPDLPVLLSSGFDAHEAATRLAKQPGIGFQAKPYRLAEVVERLERLLEEAPPPATASPS